MTVEIIEFVPMDPKHRQLYSTVSSAFEVKSVFELKRAEGNDRLALSLHEKPVRKPRNKDYDPDGEWIDSIQRFVGAENSIFVIAMEGDQPVGAAAGLRYCEDAEFFCMTDGRSDVAVLADIRVSPGHRGQGIGRELFRRVADWGKDSGMRLLKIETQNVNVPACRFYQRVGATLGGVQLHHYSGQESDEIMLLWYLEL